MDSGSGVAYFLITVAALIAVAAIWADARALRHGTPNPIWTLPALLAVFIVASFPAIISLIASRLDEDQSGTASPPIPFGWLFDTATAMVGGIIAGLMVIAALACFLIKTSNANTDGT